MARFAADTLQGLKMELAQAFDRLNSPKEPKAIFACATADRPPASDFKYRQLFDTDLNQTFTSNGSAWV